MEESGQLHFNKFKNKPQTDFQKGSEVLF